ncbi:FIG00347566: hypothetical protein [hydrothermal vent metagenome]|uniref:DUF1800 domain-containing protein n=1 Tax=hydrothermal vent metagenome TaxID=652676 RepID=A0A3B0VCT8_9ZZZZ
MASTNRRDLFRQLFNPPEFSVEGVAAVSRNATLTAEQEASRFLAQATLGADLALIQEVAATGIEAWIDQQFAIPQSQILDYLYAELYDEADIGNEDADSPWRSLFRYALWQTTMKGSDLLRQRVALALSEIVVISTETGAIYAVANGAADWYDMLLRNAFGNFRTLLQDVTLHPLMGSYLSHAGNRKTDTVENRFPDENYAREIMQLFTIGLFLLNDDGSLILDGENEPIPTYDNSHITEFAKIFTGIQYDFDGDPHVTWTPDFESGWLNPYTAVRPLKMWDEEHELGSKTLLNGYVVSDGQTGMADLNEALDHLFNHPNVGPFIGLRLIQRLVKSNPSPAYIGRVTAVFNDNGSGVRGDMQAIIKAILLDDEARNPSFITDPAHGKLREPFFRFTQMVRSFHFSNPQDKFWDAGWTVDSNLRQFMFNAPSVFNFFLPGYRPPGAAGSAGLAAPEFQLLNSYTAISTINFWYSRLEWGYVIDLPDSEQEIKGQTYNLDQPQPDLSYELTLATDVSALLDHLDLLLTYGTLSTEMRGILETAVSGYAADGADDIDVVNFAIFLFMSCPEYAIQV